MRHSISSLVVLLFFPVPLSFDFGLRVVHCLNKSIITSFVVGSTEKVV